VFLFVVMRVIQALAPEHAPERAAVAPGARPANEIAI
jgi:hypothetical protein